VEHDFIKKITLEPDLTVRPHLEKKSPTNKQVEPDSDNYFGCKSGAMR
jgi:hypothetical protein